MLTTLKPFPIAFVVVAAWFLPSIADGKGSGQPPEIEGVRVGFADRYKVGLWTPVEIRLRGGDPDAAVQVVLTVPDGEGIPTEIATAADNPIRLLPGQQSRVTLYARFGRVKSALGVELRENGSAVARRTFPNGDAAEGQAILSAVDERSLLVVIGDGAMVEGAFRMHGYEPAERPVVAALDDVASLPTQWFGYEGVDTVALLTSDAARLSELLGDTPQAAALRAWVAAGGRLVAASGAVAENVFAADSALRPLLPGKLAGVASLRQTGGLESYCRSTTPVPLGGDTGLTVAQLSDVEGSIDAVESGVPLVVRSAYGLGRVTFFAAAVDRAPLSLWSDRPHLVARLLDLSPPRAAGRTAAGGLHAGYRDLTGHLRSTLDQFAGVRSVPFWAVAALAIVYLLLIGPVDYFVLRRFGIRPQWTWLTFPLVVIAFIGVAIVIGMQTKGHAVGVHQAEIVDADLGSRRVRGQTWFNLYSPTATTYSLSVEPAVPTVAGNATTLVAWQGLAGRALGGMTVDTPLADPMGTGAAYALAPTLDALADVPLATASSKSFTARWLAPIVPPLESTLREAAQHPAGVLTNKSSAIWEDCLLVYDRWAFELGTLRPGESAEVSTASKRSELKTLLTGRRIVFDNSKDKFHQETRPYDQTSLDTAYVLRAMLFYQAAGGAEYTGLANDQAPQIDLSPLLTTGRAILVARVAAPDDATASRVLVDGQPVANVQRTVLYRFVIPVEKSR